MIVAGSIVRGPCRKKVSRPYCVLIPPSSVGDQTTLVCLVTSKKERAYYPGSLEVEAKWGLTQSSLLTPLLHHFDASVLKEFDDCGTGNVLPDDLYAALTARVIATTCEPISRGYSAIYSHLPPPGLRGEPRPSEALSVERAQLRCNFEILRRCAWRPPPHGSLLRFPVWSPRREISEYAMVLSSNAFNTRYPYPKLHVTPLFRALDVQGAEEAVRVSLGVIASISDQELFAVTTRTFTLDYGFTFFDACSKGHFWLIPKSHPRYSGVCLQCDLTAAVELPEVLVDTTAAVAADRFLAVLARRISNRSQVEPPQEGRH
jgi:hypothetical protein